MCCSPWGPEESDTTERLNNDGDKEEWKDPSRDKAPCHLCEVLAAVKTPPMLGATKGKLTEKNP